MPGHYLHALMLGNSRPQLWRGFKAFAPPYQSYFASHAVTGDPNKEAIGKAKAHPWQVASVVAGNLTNVVEATAFSALFDDITDTTNSDSNCEFWKGIASAIQLTSGSEESLKFTVQDGSVRESDEL